MQTLNLSEASKLLNMHENTVKVKARSGDIPAAKPGKCWVFIDVDLIDWLREQYTNNRQTVSAHKKEEYLCSSSKEKKATTGIINFPLKEKQYTDLLEPTTKKKRKK